MAMLTYFPGIRAVLVPVGRFAPRPGRTVLSIGRHVLVHTAFLRLPCQQGLYLLQEPLQLPLQVDDGRSCCVVLCVWFAVRSPTARVC